METSRRVLGLCHGVLMGLDGHYRARIMARDAILAQHHPAATQTPTPSKPMPTVGPSSKQASKGVGKNAPPPAQPKGTPSTSTTPTPATARTATTTTSTAAGSGGTDAGKATVPQKTPPAKPTAAAAPAAPPGTVKPGVVAHIGKRPPVVPTAPFEDTTAQDLELMVDRPVGTAKAPSPSPPPTASLGYLDMIVPDLEDHLPPAPAIKAMPPVPESPMSSEEAEVVPVSTEEDDDAPVAVEPWPRDDEEDDARVQPALATPAAPQETAQDHAAGAEQVAKVEEQQAASSADLPQTAAADDQDAPLPPPKFPPPDVVDRERRRAERRARERAERDAERAEREAAERATLEAWADFPDPCNVLPTEPNSIWTLPPGVPPQPAPSRHADAHVQGYCNLGCETPKRLRTNVCLGRCYRPIIQTRAGTVHKHHFCSPCDRARTARDR